MSEFARFALAVFVTIVVWILWMMVSDVPGANFGAKLHLLGILMGPIFGLSVYLATDQ